MKDTDGTQLTVGDEVIWWSRGSQPGPRPMRGRIFEIGMGYYAGKDTKEPLHQEYALIQPTSHGLTRSRLRYGCHIRKV